MEALTPAVLRLQIPFCARDCAFCQKPRLPGWDSQRLHSYVQALLGELRANADSFSDREVCAIRVGGGNATALEGEDLWDLYRCIRDCFPLAPDAPVTILASPFQISGGRLAFYNRLPVARYDYELFSLSAGDDSWLGFPDPTEKLRWAANMTHAQAGSMGGVLLLGHPAQSPGNFRKSLVAFTRLPACHLTLLPHPDSPAASLDPAELALLEQAGYVNYAPGRFARPGHEDRYTQLKRAGADELAFGLGARTRFAGAVSENTLDLDTYLAHSDDFLAITARAYPAN